MVQIVEKQIVIFISLSISMIFSQLLINSLENINKQAAYNSLSFLMNKIFYGIEIVSLHPSNEYSCIFSINENISISNIGNKIIIKTLNNKNPIYLEERIKINLNINCELNAGTYLLRIRKENDIVKIIFENISDKNAIRNY